MHSVVPTRSQHRTSVSASREGTGDDKARSDSVSRAKMVKPRVRADLSWVGGHNLNSIVTPPTMDPTMNTRVEDARERFQERIKISHLNLQPKDSRQRTKII